MEKQQSIATRIAAAGRMILATVFVLCVADISGLSARRSVAVPLVVYLSGIFTGVALQFIASAVRNMRVGKNAYHE